MRWLLFRRVRKEYYRLKIGDRVKWLYISTGIDWSKTFFGVISTLDPSYKLVKVIGYRDWTTGEIYIYNYTVFRMIDFQSLKMIKRLKRWPKFLIEAKLKSL